MFYLLLFVLQQCETIVALEGVYPPFWGSPNFYQPNRWAPPPPPLPVPYGARRTQDLPGYRGLVSLWESSHTEPSSLMSYPIQTTTVESLLKTEPFTESTTAVPSPPTWMNYRQRPAVTTMDPEMSTLNPLPKEDEPTTTVQSILGLFNIVRFSHFSCDAGNGQNGSCYTSSECRQRGGVNAKSCAMGFGVCCLFNVTCNQEVSRNATYFINPRFPRMYAADGSCSVTIPKLRDDICQMRLDLMDFDLLRPQSGDCNSDRLIITGQNANHVVPPICGLNSGQHVYVDIEMAQGPIQLNILTSGPGERKWNIRISQIPCSTNYRAPDNCLQYFTGVKGNFKSFNYDHISFPSEEGYLNNLDYTICIRKEAGFCNMAYTNGDLPGQHQFSIINVDKLGMPLLPPDLSGSGIRDCPDDYLNLNGTPLCGDRLNADTHLPNHALDKPVIDSTPGQFIVRFHSDHSTTARGFNLTYQQFPCGSIMMG